ncbi:hypothetical protein MLGJGCBP_04374 [Rhodococcus sp. T7]|nr:hypothetical protein MLGJGCBP_04374 [Rhodococcus sp. T7]
MRTPDAFGQRLHGRRLEQGPHHEFDAECGIHTCDDPRRGERISAEVEEAVVETDSLHTQDVREHPRDGLLLRGGRSSEFGGGGQEFRRGQCGSIEFPHRCQRQLVQYHDRRRHHVRRQLPCGVVRQLGHGEGLPGGGQHVRHEHRVAGRCRALHRHRGPHPRMGVEDRVDLAEFDAEAAHLHLEITAAQVLQCVVGSPPHHVPGAVHPVAGAAERVGHEAFRRERRPAVVPAGEAVTGDVQLPGHAGRHRHQPLVKDDLAESAERATQRDCAVRGQRHADVRHDGGLGGPVRIRQSAAGRPPLHQFRGARFATEHDVPEVGESVRLDRAERCGGDESVSDVLRLQEPGQFLAAVDRGRHDHHGRRGGEHVQVLRDGRVETRCGEMQNPGGLRRTGSGELLGCKVVQAAVGDHDPLGPAGRTGRVDHVRRILRAERPNPVGVGDGGQTPTRTVRPERVVVEHQPRHRSGEPGPHGRHGHTQCGTRVVEHVLDPLGRVVRVGGQERGPGLCDRQHRQHRLDRAGHAQCHDVLRPDAALDQDARQLVGALVQFPVRHVDSEIRERDTGGVGFGCRREQFG